MGTIISTEPIEESIYRKVVPFRWAYVILPLTILLITIFFTAYFYHLLPDKVACYFKSGAPDGWINPSATILWAAAPQFFLTLLAVATVWVITKLSMRSQQTENTTIKAILPLMGNMPALPQIIHSFAMLDIFSYNTYQIHLMPLWLFALLVMVSGGIIVSV
ncbi:hypothetical protein ACFLXZ_02140, partial [Chloroflexota bacterium]